MTSRINQPFAFFHDSDGSALEFGYVYIGTANANPETSPLVVYTDAGLTTIINQPIRTNAGFAVYNGSPTSLYIDDNDFSITVRDKNQALVYTKLDDNGALITDDNGQVVDDIPTLLALPVPLTGITQVVSYHPDGPVSSGARYFYDEDEPRTNHNGGTIISPIATYPADWNDQGQRQLWFSTVGQSGTGCYLLINDDEYLSTEHFGTMGTGLVLEDEALNAAMQFVDNVLIPEGDYTLDLELTYLRDGQRLIGAGMDLTTITSTATRADRRIIADGLTNIYLADMTIDCDLSPIEGAHAWRNCVDSLMERVQMLNGDLTTMEFTTCTRCVATDCIANGQKRYTPGGKSPFIFGDGCIDCQFVRCHVLESEADPFDNDASYGCLITGCTATSSTPRDFYSVWSEGEGDTTGYPVIVRDFVSRGYKGGVGISENTIMTLDGLMAFDCGDADFRAIWPRNDYSKISNITIKGGSSGGSSTNALILCEGGADISNVTFADVSTGNNLFLSYSGGASEGKVVSLDGIRTRECAGCTIGFGNTNNGAKTVNMSNSVLTDVKLDWSLTEEKTYHISDCEFRTDVGGAFNAITGARVKACHIDNCKFIDTTGTSVVSAINLTLDTFNTYVSNCEFDGWGSVTTNATIMEGNTYANLTVTPTAWINPFLGVGHAEVTVTTGGTYYAIPNTTDNNTYNFNIISNDPTHATGQYSVTRSSPGALDAVVLNISGTRDFGTGNFYSLRSLVGDSTVMITHPTSGRVAEINYTFVSTL